MPRTETQSKKQTVNQLIDLCKDPKLPWSPKDLKHHLVDRVLNFYHIPITGDDITADATTQDAQTEPNNVRPVEKLD